MFIIGPCFVMWCLVSLLGAKEEIFKLVTLL